MSQELEAEIEKTTRALAEVRQRVRERLDASAPAQQVRALETDVQALNEDQRGLDELLSEVDAEIVEWRHKHESLSREVDTLRAKLARLSSKQGR